LGHENKSTPLVVFLAGGSIVALATVSSFLYKTSPKFPGRRRGEFVPCRGDGYSDPSRSNGSAAAILPVAGTTSVGPDSNRGGAAFALAVVSIGVPVPPGAAVAVANVIATAVTASSCVAGLSKPGSYVSKLFCTATAYLLSLTPRRQGERARPSVGLIVVMHY